MSERIGDGTEFQPYATTNGIGENFLCEVIDGGALERLNQGEEIFFATSSATFAIHQEKIGLETAFIARPLNMVWVDKSVRDISTIISRLTTARVSQEIYEVMQSQFPIK